MGPGAVPLTRTAGARALARPLTSDSRAAFGWQAGREAAGVMVNACTRVTDGVGFGVGAEIGISTPKLHARGPMGLAELTTTKWVVEGDGQIRP